jgi:cytochrome P450
VSACLAGCLLAQAMKSKATLLIISAAGFGLHISWKDSPQEVPDGHNVSFTKAVSAAMRDLYVKMMVPTNVFKFAERVHIPGISPRLNNATIAFDELRSYLLEIISDARNSLIEGKGAGDAALLRALVQANMDEEISSRQLSDDELLSNVFVFFLAGHGTLAVEIRPSRSDVLFRNLFACTCVRLHSFGAVPGGSAESL